MCLNRHFVFRDVVRGNACSGKREAHQARSALQGRDIHRIDEHLVAVPEALVLFHADDHVGEFQKADPNRR